MGLVPWSDHRFDPGWRVLGLSGVFGAEPPSDIGGEHGHGLTGHRLGGLVVATGQVEQGGKGNAPLQEEEPGPGGLHVGLRVAVAAGDAPGNEQTLGLHRLQEGQRYAGGLGQLLERQ